MIVTVLTRGSLPILVPIVAFPAAAQDLFGRAASGLGLEVVAMDLGAPWLRVVILVALASLLLLRPPEAEPVRRAELEGPVRRLAVDLIPVTVAALGVLAALTA